MDLVIDKRGIDTITYVDRDNAHYGNKDNVTKLINMDRIRPEDIVFSLIFNRFDFDKSEVILLKILFDKVIYSRENHCDKQTIVKYCSDKIGKSERTINRYLDKLSSKGIILVVDKTIKFTTFFNPVRYNIKETDFIVIETNPYRTSKKLDLLTF